jgi:hypothetical protein
MEVVLGPAVEDEHDRALEGGPFEGSGRLEPKAGFAGRRDVLRTGLHGPVCLFEQLSDDLFELGLERVQVHRRDGLVNSVGRDRDEVLPVEDKRNLPQLIGTARLTGAPHPTHLCLAARFALLKCRRRRPQIGNREAHLDWLLREVDGLLGNQPR